MRIKYYSALVCVEAMLNHDISHTFHKMREVRDKTEEALVVAWMCNLTSYMFSISMNTHVVPHGTVP